MKKLFLPAFLLFIINLNIYGQQGSFALKFDGTDDYVAFSPTSDITLTHLTIEAWIKPFSSSSNQIFSWVKKTNPVNVLEFRLMNGKLEFGINNGTWASLTGSTNIKTGVWTHVAVTKSSSSISLYINGRLEASGTIDKNPVINQFELGYYQDDNSSILRNFNGEMDEVRIWKVARTAAEINSNIFRELTGSEANLDGYFKMSDSTGTSLPDNSNLGDTMKSNEFSTASSVPFSDDNRVAGFALDAGDTGDLIRILLI